MEKLKNVWLFLKKYIFPAIAVLIIVFCLFGLAMFIIDGAKYITNRLFPEEKPKAPTEKIIMVHDTIFKSDTVTEIEWKERVVYKDLPANVKYDDTATKYVTPDFTASLDTTLSNGIFVGVDFSFKKKQYTRLEAEAPPDTNKIITNEKTIHDSVTIIQTETIDNTRFWLWDVLGVIGAASFGVIIGLLN